MDRDNYTRVTDVLYPFSGLHKVPEHILKAASERGTKVHDACEGIMKGFYANVDESIGGYIHSFKQWEDETIDTIFPDRFYCDDLKITGKCDCLIPQGSGFTLIDFKTSARESKSWVLQGSAYAYLASKYNYPITSIQFVKLSKEGRAPTVYTYEHNFPMFLKCLETYRFFFENQEQEIALDYL